MKTFKFMGISMILASAFIVTPFKAGAEEKGLTSPTEAREKLNDGILLRNFPVLGDRLDEEMIRLSKTLFTARWLNGKMPADDWRWFMTSSREMQLPWPGTTKAAAVVNINDDMQILASDYLATNKTTFTNSLGTPQTWKTPEFSYTVENNVSTTNTVSTGIPTTVEHSFNVLFESGKVPVTATFDYSNPAPVTNTKTETWTIPAQEVRIEPNQTVRVEWIATVGKAIGTTNLDFRLEGIIPMAKKGEATNGYNMKNAFVAYDQLERQDLISKVLEDYRFTSAERSLYTNRVGDSVDRTFGTAKYEVKQGLEMTMKVYEVKDVNGRASNNDRLIQTKTFSADELRVK